jgi:hypothetical protein
MLKKIGPKKFDKEDFIDDNGEIALPKKDPYY